MKRGCGPLGNLRGGCLYRMTTQDWQCICVCMWCVRVCVCLTWVRHNKLSPETSLCLEVDNQTALLIDTHAGWIHGSCNITESSFALVSELM